MQCVLSKRQNQELADLDQSFALQKKVLVDAALEKLMHNHDKQRDDLLKQHEAQLKALDVRNNLCYDILFEVGNFSDSFHAVICG